jgi:hypothetical protein
MTFKWTGMCMNASFIFQHTQKYLVVSIEVSFERLISHSEFHLAGLYV